MLEEVWAESELGAAQRRSTFDFPRNNILIYLLDKQLKQTWNQNKK